MEFEIWFQHFRQRENNMNVIHRPEDLLLNELGPQKHTFGGTRWGEGAEGDQGDRPASYPPLRLLEEAGQGRRVARTRASRHEPPLKGRAFRTEIGQGLYSTL